MAPYPTYSILHRTYIFMLSGESPLHAETFYRSPFLCNMVEEFYCVITIYVLNLRFHEDFVTFFENFH